MILIFEQDIAIRNGKLFNWKPMFFKGAWEEKTTYRLGWGLWSVSYYPCSDLRSFFSEAKSKEWHN